MQIAFVGLGNMGQAIAGNLLKSGHQLLVWNRSPASVQALLEKGAKAADDLRHAFNADIVFSMLADDRALRELLLESGLLASLAGPRVHVNMATISVALADELAALHAARGISYVAAPVLGRPEVAANAALHILAAGPSAAIEQVQPLFELIGKRTWPLGEPASRANALKLAVNFMLVSAIESMAEAAVLTKAHGIEAATLIELISQSIFPGPVYQGYGKLIAEDRYEPAAFKAVLGLKDVNLALAAAESVAVPLPMAELVRERLVDAVAQGEGEMDLAVLGRAAARRGR